MRVILNLVAFATAIALDVWVSELPGFAGVIYEDCQGKYKNGAMPRKDELEVILNDHKEWLSSYRDKLKQLTEDQLYDPRKANLCNANLRPPVILNGVDLTGANLRGAIFAGNDLTGAHLKCADLAGANMESVKLIDARLDHGIRINLTRARMEGANLEDGRFFDATLTQIFFREGNMSRFYLDRGTLDRADLRKVSANSSFLMSVDMTHALLDQADFSQSTFNKVNFTKARIVKTNLSHAVIQRGIFNETIFEPSGADTLLILDSSGLSTITFEDPRPVVQLRKSMKEAGLWNEERALTSALRKFELRSASRTERFMQRWLFGGWLSDYGANPWRSIQFLIVLIAVGIPFYALSVWRTGTAKGPAGIWAVWPDGSINKEEPIRIGARFFFENYWLNLLWASFYFSLVSTFHIGWRDLNVGTWITRIQPREFSLRPMGWVRFVSGTQSLLSVYLLALWLLTYFGRPFE